MASKKPSAKRTRKAPKPVEQLKEQLVDLKTELVEVEQDVVKDAKPLLPKVKAVYDRVAALLGMALAFVDAKGRPSSVAVARGILLATVLWAVAFVCLIPLTIGPIGLCILGAWFVLMWAIHRAW